ncbi:alpha/beta fold hydrolase [Steroidobacter agaridevorans]|uniref:alpha/beta fold hydrolase n=1 Tax=Steroidobacter agaridevorans TaxID=2695856 RepID=UPI0013273493|nr:alpha/beta hydrolase [Steroidobacter agaridevorans]GFE85860.1 hydrolase [Steroidobacter agaridevorans]
MTIEATDSFVDVPGGRIFVRQWQGSRTRGAPLVLLHDSLGSVGLWRDFPAVLAQASSRHVIAYDRLGFGQSTQRTDRPSFAFIDEEAERYFPAVRDGLGLDRFALFGHSVGGAMALRIAASLPESCEAVVTESAQCFVESRTLEGIRAAQTLFEDPAQLQKLAKRHGDRAQWVLDAWIKVWLAPEFRDWSLDPHLGRVACPVLAIHGDQDEYGSEEFPKRIASGVRGPSQMVLLNDCGHVPHRERSEQIVRLTASFLESLNTTLRV